MVSHWVLRIDDGVNFWKGAPFGTWATASNHSSHKSFLKKACSGDILWFVTSKSGGQAVAVATLTNIKERNTQCLLTGSLTDSMLGWEGAHNWTHEILYNKLYCLTECNIFLGIRGNAPIRRYTSRKFHEKKYNIELISAYKTLNAIRIYV